MREKERHKKLCTLVCVLLGCHHVIDKSKEDLWKAAETHSPGGYQVIFDANGIETLQESYDHLAMGGRLVIYGMCLIYGRSLHFLRSKMDKAVDSVLTRLAVHT